MTLRIEDIRVGDVLVPKMLAEGKRLYWSESELREQQKLLDLPSCTVDAKGNDCVSFKEHNCWWNISRFSHIARQDPDLGSWTVTEVDQAPCCTCPSLLNGHSPGCGWHVAPETTNVWGPNGVWGIPQPKPAPSYKTESDNHPRGSLWSFDAALKKFYSVSGPKWVNATKVVRVIEE